MVSCSYEQYHTSAGNRWSVRYRDSARRQHKKKGFTTKSAAVEWASKHVITAITEGTYTDPARARITIGELAQVWIDSHRSIWKPSNLRTMEISWRVHVAPVWEHRRLNTITHSEVQSWVNDLANRKSASVVLRAFGILRGIIDTAILDNRIVRSPLTGIALPRKKPRPRVYLTADQLLHLADCSGEHRCLILVLGLCGLRWGEATALTVLDIDFSRNRLRVNKSATKVGNEVIIGTPKSGRAREIPMPNLVRDALHKEIRGKTGNDLIFPSFSGGYLGQQSVGKNHRGWYKSALERAGLPLLRIHDLRHTAASIAISAGAHVKAVQRMLGHASAAMTLDTYADLFDADLDTVADNINTLLLSSIN